MSAVYREKVGSFCLALENADSRKGAAAAIEHLSRRSCSSLMGASEGHA